MSFGFVGFVGGAQVAARDNVDPSKQEASGPSGGGPARARAPAGAAHARVRGKRGSPCMAARTALARCAGSCEHLGRSAPRPRPERTARRGRESPTARRDCAIDSYLLSAIKTHAETLAARATRAACAAHAIGAAERIPSGPMPGPSAIPSPAQTGSLTTSAHDGKRRLVLQGTL